MKRLEKSLGIKTDKELKDLEKRTYNAYQVIEKTYTELLDQLYRNREVKKNLWIIIGLSRKIRGERKGRDCPALVKDERSIYCCKARLGWTIRSNREEIYKRFCYSCRLTHEKAKQKMIWNTLFKNRRY